MALFAAKPRHDIASFPYRDVPVKSVRYCADRAGESLKRVALQDRSPNIPNTETQTDESREAFFLEDFTCPMSPRRPPKGSTDGGLTTAKWKFYFRMAGLISDELLDDNFGLGAPEFHDFFALIIKHRKTGIRFRFSAPDAISKIIEERFPSRKFKCNEHIFCIENCSYNCSLPTYPSPLEPVDAFDSAFTGRLIFKKSNEKVWEDIDWETLLEEFLWMNKYKRICGRECTIFRRRATKREKEEGLLEALANVGMELYSGYLRYAGEGYPPFPRSEGESSCDCKLVVSDSGWFFRLYQLFFNAHGARRTREMTMHCRFEDNIIYREIIEQQSKVFEIGFPKSREKEIAQEDLQMCLRYHEIKRLNIEGADSREVCDATRYRPYVVPQLDETNNGELELSVEKIEMLLADCGALIKLVETETHTHVEIIPLFRHPSTSEATNRTVHIFGSKDDIEHAKSLLAELLQG